MLPMDSSNQNQTLAVCFFHRKFWNMQNWSIFVFAARWLHSTLRWTTNYPLRVVPLLEKHFEREVDTRRTRTHTTNALATGGCLISSQLWSKSLSLIIVFVKGACLRLQEKHNIITVSNCCHLLSTPKLPWPWLGRTRQQLHLAAVGAPNRWDFLVAMVYNPTGQLDVWNCLPLKMDPANAIIIVVVPLAYQAL